MALQQGLAGDVVIKKIVVCFAILACVVAALAIAGAATLSHTGAGETENGPSSYGTPEGTGNTTIVDSRTGYGSIERALRNAGDGDTILVYSGTYPGCLVVDRRVILKGVDTGGGKPVITAQGSGNTVTLAADGIWLEGFDIRNAGNAASGVLVEADGCTIAGNDVTRCPDGIHLRDVRNTTLLGNHLYRNDRAGIYVSNCSDVRASLNRANDNIYGIYMEKSSRAVIDENNCSDNIDIEIYIENMTDTLVRGNTATSERIKAKKIDGIGIRYGENVTFDGNYVSRHYYGIKVYESHDCVVENNLADGSGVNIRLDFETHDTTLRNNTVKNGVDNVYLHSSAYNNTVENNTCYNGREGIYLLESQGNTVRGNDVFNNTIGIRLISTTGNTVTGNHAYDNSANIVQDGGNNTVCGNFEYRDPLKPKPADTVVPGTTADDTSGGNPVLDFISSIIRMIFP